MAPMKRPRESASKKNDKLKRRKRMADNTDPLYKCLGKLCGEECQQDLASVRGGEPPRRDSHSVPKRDRRDNRHDELRDAVTDLSDEEYEDDAPSQGSTVARSGRVGKPSKPKKGPTSAANSELPFKQGVQKAKRWLCAALDFGVQSEYLRLEDSKGKVLRVASELLQVGNEGGTGGSSNKPRVLQRVAGDEPAPPRSLQQRKRRREEAVPDEPRDDDDVAERSKRRHRRNRSRSSKRGGKKRSGRSRSRGGSRSKRRHGKRRAVRSRSENPEGETRPQQAGGAEGAEQDDMDCKESGTAGSESRRDENNGSQHEDDKSSVKSLKSTQNSESQNTVEEKKEDDGSNDEDEDDEDDGKKK